MQLIARGFVFFLGCNLFVSRLIGLSFARRHRQQRPVGPEGLRVHGGAGVRDRGPRRMQSG